MEVFSRETSDEDCDYETEGDEDDSGDAKRTGTEVLGMQCERVVVWDVVL